MDVPQLFCLSSKQFESRMRSNLLELQVGKDFCDVTIACEDQEIEAHKVVLAGGSLLFNNLLKQNHHHHPFIFLRGINFSYLSKILDFLYQGEVDIDKNELYDFLSVAQDLKINGLTEDSKQSKHFVEEGAKTKRPRLTNSPEQDLNLDDYDICTEMDDFGSEPITESSVNSDGKTEDDDVENVILPDQQLAETHLTIPSGDQKVVRKLRIRDIAKLTENPLQLKSYSMDLEQETPENGFICEHCYRKYANKFTFNRHMVTAHNEVCYSCEECNFKSKWKESLKVHIDSFHNGESYSCEKCRFKAPQEEILKIHIDSVHKNSEILYSCYKCNYESSNQGKLINHLFTTHDENWSAQHLKINGLTEDAVEVSKPPEEGSKKKRQRLLGISSHFQDLDNDIGFEVKMDDFGFEPDEEKASLVENHLPSGDQKDDRNLRMRNLEKLTKNPLQTQSYSMQKDISKNDFICEQCNKKYVSKYTLKTHIDTVHNGIFHFCEECDFKTKWKNYLKIHIDSAHYDNRVSYSCEKCEYTAKCIKSLQIHIHSVHNGVLYYCEKCHFKTELKKTLKIHIDSVHNGISYSCEKCDYTATEEGQLKSHILTIHNGNRFGYEGALYSCELCDYKATRKTYLERHIKSSHKESLEPVSISNWNRKNTVISKTT